jgi:hypothetical protein
MHQISFCLACGECDVTTLGKWCGRDHLPFPWSRWVSLLYGMTDRNINQLQQVQNSIARLVTNSNSRRHITSLRWASLATSERENWLQGGASDIQCNDDTKANLPQWTIETAQTGQTSSIRQSLFSMWGRCKDSFRQSRVLPLSTDSVELTTMYIYRRFSFRFPLCF